MVVTHGSLRSARSRTTLTIGSFDGVHRGHRALIERVVAKGREPGVSSCVLTFEPHPREFFAGDAAPPRLTRLHDKLELLAAAGVERVHLIRFDARFAAMSAAHFIEDVLVRGLSVAWLLVGRDFRFGAKRAAYDILAGMIGRLFTSHPAGANLFLYNRMVFSFANEFTVRSHPIKARIADVTEGRAILVKV